MELEWEPSRLWEPKAQGALVEDDPILLPTRIKVEDSDGDWIGIRVENKLTRQEWFFESVKSLYFLSCVEGQFAIAGRHWRPGVYEVWNKTEDALRVITMGRSYDLPPGKRLAVKAHDHV